MKAFSYTNAADFLAATGDILRSDEVRYGLLYGIAQRVADAPNFYGDEAPWFCTVGDDTGICALAWRTPPFPVGLAWYAGYPEEAASPLIEAIRSHWQVIPGVVGDREVTDLFAESWCHTCGLTVQSTMAQRIYRLDTVNNVPPAPGRMRLAGMADKDLVSNWIHAFNIDCFGESYNQPERDITPVIENGEIYLWEDGRMPVSMSIKTRPTDHGMTIGYVYTPPEQRRKGYATACVAGVCREILNSGFDFCTLYTDLSNPTSNSIYMKIGFKPVCDSVQHIFSTPVL